MSEVFRLEGNLNIDIGDATRELQDVRRETQDTTNELRRLDGTDIDIDTSQVTRELNDISQSASRTEADLDAIGDTNINIDTGQATRELNDVRQSAEEVSDSLEEVNRSADNAGGGFTIFGGAVANVIGNTITSAIGKIKDLVGALFELPEATAEFRSNIAKLEGSTKQYGYSTTETNGLLKEMYGYFGDEQVAVNAISNLQGIGLSQSDLNNTLDNAVGVWSAYGDSIPIESLTESINETSQVGKVTGSLADALNWAGISEDEFNQKLEKCNSTKDRAKLITDTLNKAYGESKRTYDENTESMRLNREAQLDVLEAQSRLAEAIEPVITLFNILKGNVLNGVASAFEKIGAKINELKDRFKGLNPKEIFDSITTGIESGLPNLIDKGLEIVQGFAESFSQNAPKLVAAGMELLKSLATGIADSLPSLIEKIPTIVTTIANTISSMYPIIIVKGLEIIWALIKGIIKAIPTLVANIPQIIEAIFSVWNAVSWPQLGKNLINGIINGIKGLGGSLIGTVKGLLGSLKGSIDDVWGSIKSSTGSAWNGVKSTISNACSGIFNTVKSKFNSVKSTISSAINSAKNVVSSGLNAIKGFFSRCKLSLPKISLPHFFISGKFSLKPPSVPKIGVNWYKDGGIIDNPTLLSLANGTAHIGGEAGKEAVVPLDSFYKKIGQMLDNNSVSNYVVNFNFSDIKIRTDQDLEKLAKMIDEKLQKFTNRNKRMKGSVVV